MRKAGIGSVVALFCTFSTGCLVPFGYPSFAYVPTAFMGKQPLDCHAFRVDVKAEIVDIGESDTYFLAPIAPTATGCLPSQTGVSLDYGFYVFGIAVNYPVCCSHGTYVRLYRPGYRLIELGSWQLAGEVIWKEAKELLSQEEAVDNLLSTPPLSWRSGVFVSSEQEPWRLGQLQSGSASRGQRETLLFAADEYERIAKDTRTESEESRPVQERLMAKAKWVRCLAEK
jgi:hypothetical protein